MGRAEPDRAPPPSPATPTRRAQHASRGPHKNTAGSALRRRRIFSVRFIRAFHSQNSLSASRSVQEAPASLRNYCSNGMAVRFRRLEDHGSHNSGVRRRGAPDPSPSSLDKGSVYKRSAHRLLIFAWGPGDAAAALVGKRYGKNKIGKMVRHEGGRPDARVGDARVECRAAQEMKVMALRSRRTGGGFKPPHAAGPVTVSW